MNRKLCIIGAGLAGLSAGCYGQINGYDTTIYEASNGPGGLCTSWERQDYLFESCIFWFFGSSPKSPFYQMWKELGVATTDRFIHRPEFTRIEWPDGQSFKVYSDIEALSKEMKRVAPEDSKHIDKICKEAYALMAFDVYIKGPRELYHFKDYIALLKSTLPFISLLLKYKNMPIESFVESFKTPFLRDSISGLMSFLPRYPALYLMLTFGNMHKGNASFPRGGSIGVAKSLEQRYLSLGGKIVYGSKVEQILVSEGKAAGVQLESGEGFNFDGVISAADGYSTLFKLLGGKYLSAKQKTQYSSLPLFHSYIQLSFGVDCDLSSEPSFMVQMLKRSFSIGHDIIKDIRIRHYAFDPSFAPLGKSSLVVIMASSYDYWAKLYKNPEAYNREKRRIQDEIRERLIQRFPQIKGHIETEDVATPMTFERYTHNRKGSAEGWYVNEKTIDTVIERSVPGLKNFYMAGHWVEISGGLVFSALSGRYAIQRMCHDDQKSFMIEEIKRTI